MHDHKKYILWGYAFNKVFELKSGNTERTNLTSKSQKQVFVDVIKVRIASFVTATILDFLVALQPQGRETSKWTQK